MRRSRDFVEAKASFNAVTPPYGVKARMVVLPQARGLFSRFKTFSLPAATRAFFTSRKEVFMFTEPQETFDKLYDCFAARKFADLRMLLLDMEPVDIADFMEERLDETNMLMFFRLLPKELASDAFRGNGFRHAGRTY